MSRFVIIVSSCLLLCALIFGCSSDPAGPSGGPDPDPDPDPNPDGVLLEGESGDDAVDALVELPPSPAPDEEIDAGLLTTRLVAVLNPDATVGQINAALDAAGARIVSMHSDDIFVTLRIPVVADEAEARDVAAQIVAGGAFVFVMPAWQADVSPPPDEGYKELPPSGEGPIDHLTAMRFPAAWNAKGLALDIDVKTIVMVPDYYTDDQPHPEIGCQQFRIGGGNPTGATANGMWVGNHGYAVSSTVGADYDAYGPTGTSPAPRDFLEIRSVQMGGLSWPELLRAIYERLPWGTPFVLNTSIQSTPPFDATYKLQLALDSLYWRSLIAGGSGNFLHATAAGNWGASAGDDGESRYASPFNTAHMFDDLRDVIAGAGLSEADSLGLDLACTYYETENPDVASVLADVLVVGASDAVGHESAFSSRGTEIRAVGESVLAVCTDVDPGHGANPDLCDGSVWSAAGTSFASPLVAGLAAYMWSMDIDLPADQMRSKLLHAYQTSTTPGLVDAYIAVLSLDNFYFDHRVRDAILDVSGADGQPGRDGVFDEKDLELYVQAFTTANGAEDHSRYDLNGDGHTGGDTTEKLDRGSDPVPQWTAYESALTDCDILDWYADHPHFYTGDEALRDEIMIFCDPVPLADMVVMNIILDIAVTVTYHPSGNTQYYNQYQLYLQAHGGIANGNLSFFFDKAVSGDGREFPVRGSISGTVVDDGRSLLVVHVNYTAQLDGGGSKSSSYTMTDVPLMGYGTDDDYRWVSYDLSGPETCDHLSNLNIAADDGSWTVTSHGCLSYSRFRIDMYD